MDSVLASHKAAQDLVFGGVLKIFSEFTLLFSEFFDATEIY